MNRAQIRNFDERFLTGLGEVTILSAALPDYSLFRYVDEREGVRAYSRSMVLSMFRREALWQIWAMF